MTERGYFFDGISIGDSSVAPYDDTEFMTPFQLYGDFAIPKYEDELLVTAGDPTVGIVNVATGAAMVYGALYENTAVVSVAITAAANNRIDRIVLRHTAGATQTVRITKIIGVAAANPAPPALGATDFPLAWVYVPSGFDPALNVILAYNVHDERLFKQLGFLDQYNSLENVMPNSEFMAYSGGAAGNLPPDYWALDGVPTTSIVSSPLTYFDNQVRGWSVRIRSNAGAGMQTRFQVGPAGENLVDDDVVTIKGMIHIASGAVQIVAENEDSAGLFVGTQTLNFYRTGALQEYIIRVPLNTVASYSNLHIRILANAAGSDFYVGQILVVRGYVPGNFRPKHETLFFQNDVLDAAWTNTAKSTGVTTLNTAAAFGGVIPPYYRGLLYKVRANDAGSAGGACGVTMYHTDATNAVLVLSLTNLTNSVYREVVAWVANKVGDANAPVKISVTATGVLSCRVTVQPIGMLT